MNEMHATFCTQTLEIALDLSYNFYTLSVLQSRVL